MRSRTTTSNFRRRRSPSAEWESGKSSQNRSRGGARCVQRHKRRIWITAPLGTVELRCLKQDFVVPHLNFSSVISTLAVMNHSERRGWKWEQTGRRLASRWARRGQPKSNFSPTMAHFDQPAQLIWSVTTNCLSLPHRPSRSSQAECAGIGICKEIRNESILDSWSNASSQNY